MSKKNSIFSFSIILLFVFIAILFSTKFTYAALSDDAIGYINSADGATVRSSYSTSSKALDVLNDNKKITILSETFTSANSTSKTTRWYKISYGSKTGYVRSDLVDNITYSKVTVKTASGLNARKGPSTKFAKIGHIDSCVDKYLYLKANYNGSGTWYKVKVDGKYAYINGSYVVALGTTMYKYGIGTIKADGTNMRSSYSSTSSKLATLKKDTKCVLISQVYTNLKDSATKYRWFKVRYANKTGYIRSDKVSTSYSYKTNHTNGKVNIRKGPNTGYSKVGQYEKNTNIRVYLKTIYPGGKTWYKVKYNGYYRNVLGSYVEKGKVDPATAEQDNLEKIYKEELAKFPDSYKTKLEELHKQHPKWIFVAKQLSYSWDNAIEEQFAYHGANLVPSSFPEAKKAVYSDTYDFVNHKYIGFDSSAWVCASKSCLKFYMDPRNWLMDLGIFMFESFKYNEDVHSSEGIEAAVKDILSQTGIPESKAEYYMEAAKKYGISPVYLASKSRMELGSGSGKGTSGGTTVYNVYNIGASDSSGGGAQNGYDYAKKQGWTSYKKAIIEGAAFIVDGFMNNNQYSLYYERFNVLNGLSNIGTHQYCTNTVNAATMANVNYWSYRDAKLIDSAFLFEIPVYKSMPDVACKEIIKGNNNNYLNSLSAKTSEKSYTIKNEENTKYGVANDKDGVNVRKDASASAARVTTLDYGEVVEILGSKKDSSDATWYKVFTNAGTGYVKSKYLKTSYFNRFNTKYYVTVPYDVKELSVECKTNVSDATVKVTGNTGFVVGKNTIKVKVTSSSGLYKYYYIYATREAKTSKIASIKCMEPLEDEKIIDEESSEEQNTEFVEKEYEAPYNLRVVSGDELDINDEVQGSESVEDETIETITETDSIMADGADELSENADEEVSLETDSNYYLTWECEGKPTSYEIHFKSVEDDEYIVEETADNYLKLADLIENQIYEYYVVAIYNENGIESYSHSSETVKIMNYTLYIEETITYEARELEEEVTILKPEE